MNTLKFLGLITCLFLVSCDKKDPIVPNEEELITTLNYTLNPTDGGVPTVLKFSDPDGDGGKAPVITGGTLKKNQNYFGTIQILNESISPAKDISAEILNEALDHQFFYSSTAKNVIVTYSDKDSAGNPLGLKTLLKTGLAEKGTLKITLKHLPNKTAQGVVTGQIANAGGETDIEVEFPIDVQ